MKVKLSFHERVALDEILPKQGSYMVMKRVRELAEKLVFSKDEIKKHKIVIIPKGEVAQFSWDSPVDKEFEVGEIVVETIKAALEELNKNNQLMRQHITLYEKFVENSPKG